MTVKRGSETFSGYNKPKRTPNHPKKSHAVLAKEGEKIKLIRFGEKGAKTNETFGVVADTNVFFETTCALSDADQTDFFVGLCENGTASTSVPFATNNQIGFLVVDGAADIFAVCDSGGTETKTDTGVDFEDGVLSGGGLTNSRRLGFVAKGTGEVEFYVDRSLVTTTTSNIPTTQLALWIASVAGTGAANPAYVDYVLCVQQRVTDGMTTFQAR
jgi:hypothetical protein